MSASCFLPYVKSEIIKSNDMKVDVKRGMKSNVSGEVNEEEANKRLYLEKKWSTYAICMHQCPTIKLIIPYN
jgi:hypothetical protein